MIIGIPRRTLLFLPRVARRVVRKENLVTPRPRFGLLAAFTAMMEGQADLIVRGLDD